MQHSNNPPTPKEELLERIRTIYKAFNEARGWAEMIDYTLLGFDARSSLYSFLEEGARGSETVIDALNGDDLAKARHAYGQLQPKIGIILSIASKFL
jgi:hypothetical protein